MDTHLDILFAPNTVAVIGASTNLSKWGNWIAEQVARHKNKRRVYLVSSKCREIYGVQSISSIGEIPEPIDVAIVAVPLSIFEVTIDSLLLHGTKVIVGITAGFSEKDNKGYQIEKRIVEKVHKAGSTLIGPNCAGVWDSHSPFHCLPIAEFKSGPIGLISQSGGIVTDVALRLEEVGLGFSRIISTGNQADVSLTEILHSFDRDKNTKVIAMYIENEQSIPYYLFKSLSKPVVLLTPETTPVSRQAAKHHTNSTPSNSYYVSDATKTNGGLYATTVRDFVALIQIALAGLKFPTGKRTVVVTDSGGLGILASACIQQSTLKINPLSPALKQELNDEVGSLLPQANIDNPIDLINIKGGFTEPTVTTLEILCASPDVDVILCILFLIENAEINPEEDYKNGLFLSNIIRGSGGKPVVFVCKNFTSPGTKALLERWLPVYRDVETAVKILEVICG